MPLHVKEAVDVSRQVGVEVSHIEDDLVVTAAAWLGEYGGELGRAVRPAVAPEFDGVRGGRTNESAWRGWIGDEEERAVHCERREEVRGSGAVLGAETGGRGCISCVRDAYQRSAGFEQKLPFLQPSSASLEPPSELYAQTSCTPVGEYKIPLLEAEKSLPPDLHSCRLMIDAEKRLPYVEHSFPAPSRA